MLLHEAENEQRMHVEGPPVDELREGQDTSQARF